MAQHFEPYGLRLDLVAKIDENGVRSSPGTIPGYPLHPWTLLVVTCADSRVEGVTFWEASGVSLFSLFGVFVLLVFFLLS